MDSELEHIVLNNNFEDCLVEYYPHIETRSSFGKIISETKPINISKCEYTDDEYDEYVHLDKKMLIHANGEREYLMIQQKYNKISDGLFIVSKITCIDPNRFPILNNYHITSHIKIRTYEYKSISINVIEENDEIIVKISFNIVNNEKYKKDLIKHFREVISLLRHT